MNRSKKLRGRGVDAKAAVARPSERRKLRQAAKNSLGGEGAVVVQSRSPMRQTIIEKREKRKTLREQRRREYHGQDDTVKLLQATMKVVSKSQKSFKDVYLDGGPTPSTLAKWSKDAVKRPGLMTVLGALQACGNLRIAIIDEDGQIVS